MEQLKKIRSAGRPKLYHEPRKRLDLKLTQTAFDWLKLQQEYLEAESISETLEKLARLSTNN